MAKTSSIWTLLLVGAAGGLIVWVITRLSKKPEAAGLSGFGVAGSHITNSNVWLGGPSNGWGSGSADNGSWASAPDVSAAPPQRPQFDAFTREPPTRLNFSRNDRRLPGRTPLAGFTTQGVSRTDGKTIDTRPQPLVARRDVDVSVTVTNGSGVNTVRIGSEAEVRGGDGAPVPPNAVVPFPLRAGQELWGVATGASPVGTIVSER